MGELIRERYRLIDRIGRGGMGEVWRAHDEALGRQVAVKCLKPFSSVGDDEQLRVLRERFRREARVAAALQHRGITVVHDFGEDGGVLYLVMELLQGRNLAQLLEDTRRVPLPLGDLLDVAEQVAAALAYTHEHGVVHRDLKPANIVRLSEGTVKICDFGIARLGRDIGFTSRLTGTGAAMGTPHYMSPEQIAGSELDHRSDLYSFGCVLYELATGAPPFDLEDTWAVLVHHRDCAPEPPRSHRPELPEPLDRLILDLLAKEPDDRPQDASVLVKRLAAIRAPGEQAGGLPAWARRLTLGAAAGARGARPARPEGAGLTGAWSTRGASGAWPTRSASGAQPAAAALLAARHTAAVDLARGGRWEQAADAHREVAAGREGVLGADHPDTLASRAYLGQALSYLGRTAEALEVYRQVSATRARVLGPNHPDTLVTRFETAYVLGRLGDWEAALNEYRAVAAGRAEALGPDHPETLAAVYEVGIGLGRLGRGAEALELYRSLVGARGRVQGPQHPETLRARHSLGVNLGRLGRWEEALTEAREVCSIRERVLGADHPDTLASRREIAVALGWLGRWEEALVSYRLVAEGRERVFGAGHPATLAGRRDEAHCLERLGRGAEAAEAHGKTAAPDRTP